MAGAHQDQPSTGIWPRASCSCPEEQLFLQALLNRSNFCRKQLLLRNNAPGHSMLRQSSKEQQYCCLGFSKRCITLGRVLVSSSPLEVAATSARNARASALPPGTCLTHHITMLSQHSATRLALLISALPFCGDWHKLSCDCWCRTRPALVLVCEDGTSGSASVATLCNAALRSGEVPARRCSAH